METLHLDARDEGALSAAVSRAAEVLIAGGVVAAPTETVYGLAALWTCSEARRRIYQLKRRPKDKRLQMLAASLDQAYAAGVRGARGLEAVADAFWPGPLTAIVPGCEDTIGLRIPNHSFMLRLLRALPAPLAATSANASGAADACDAVEAVAGLDGKPHLVLDGGPIVEGGRASTVVSLCTDVAVLLRPGPVTAEQLSAVLGALRQNR